MRGILGDAILIAITVIVLLLVFVKLWWPPLKATINRTKRDLDDLEQFDVDSQQRQHVAKHKHSDISSCYAEGCDDDARHRYRGRRGSIAHDAHSSMSPAERAEAYKRRAHQSGLYGRK